jgi:hypothetical protein
VGEGQQHERCNAVVHAWLVVAAWGGLGRASMSAATDAVVRAWLVVAAWLGLPRARLARLARIRNPGPFVRAAILPAGRLVALAIAFLPRKRRGEARVAFLSCKALVGFDDPDVAVASERITAAVAYLTGETHSPPHPAAAQSAQSARSSHRFEALLAARLPTLRAAIKALPGDALRRCCAVIERIGDGMIHARADRRYGVDHVFGEAVFAAARFAVPAVRAPAFACNSAGRAIQLASALRDAETTATRDMLLYQAMQELPTVPRLLQWLPAGVEAGTRAAASLLAATLYRFYLQQIGAAIPRRLRHPLRTALAAAWSRRAYLATVCAIGDAVHHALDALAVRLDGSPAASAALPPDAAASSSASPSAASAWN